MNNHLNALFPSYLGTECFYLILISFHNIFQFINHNLLCIIFFQFILGRGGKSFAFEHEQLREAS